MTNRKDEAGTFNALFSGEAKCNSKNSYLILSFSNCTDEKLSTFCRFLKCTIHFKVLKLSKKKREIKVLKNLLNKEILTTDNHPK